MKKLITWILDGVRFAGLFLACCWYSLVCGGEIAAEEAEIAAEEGELAAGGGK